MNRISISLDKEEAIKTTSGYIIMKDGNPMEVLNVNIEMLIDPYGENPIENIKAALDIFAGTKGIKSVNIKYGEE